MARTKSAPRRPAPTRSTRTAPLLLALVLVLRLFGERLELLARVLLPLRLRIATEQLLEIDLRVAAILEREERLPVPIHRIGHALRLREVVDHLRELADGVGELALREV